MFKKIAAFIMILALFSVQCKLIDFGSSGTNITVQINRLFQVSESSSHYSDMAFINFQEEYDDVGVNPEDVISITLSNVQVIIERNGTGDATTADGEIWFRLQAPGQPEYKLASFPSTNVNSILNVPVNPFLIGATVLTLDPTGAQKLTQILSTYQAPTLVFYVRGDVNTPPIDFDVRLIVDFIVKVKI